MKNINYRNTKVEFSNNWLFSKTILTQMFNWKTHNRSFDWYLRSSSKGTRLIWVSIKIFCAQLVLWGTFKGKSFCNIIAFLVSSLSWSYVVSCCIYYDACMTLPIKTCKLLHWLGLESRLSKYYFSFFYLVSY